jgi:hypothetical protein
MAAHERHERDPVDRGHLLEIALGILRKGEAPPRHPPGKDQVDGHEHLLLGGSSFPDELYQVPRSWAEQAFPNLIYYQRHPKGGHFAAWEQPDYFTQDLRNGFRSLR